MKWMRRFHSVSTHFGTLTLGQPLVRSLVRSHGLFTRSALLASLARSAALIRLIARSITRSQAHRKEIYVFELNASISYSFNPTCAGGNMRPDITHRIYRIKFAWSSTKTYTHTEAAAMLNARKYTQRHMHNTEDASLACWPCSCCHSWSHCYFCCWWRRLQQLRHQISGDPKKGFP